MCDNAIDGEIVGMLKRIKKSVLHVLTPYSVAHENWVAILLPPKRKTPFGVQLE